MKTKILFFVLAAVLPVAAFSQTPDHNALNAALGSPFWSDDSLWDDSLVETASRLRLPSESKSKISSSYRLYPKEDARLFGARPYSIALYGKDSVPVQLSVTYANKGDYANLAQINQLLEVATGSQRTALRKSQSDALRELPKAIEADATAIRGVLTAALGEPVKDKVGTGRSMEEKAERWDWNGHAILLTVKKEEYVSLRILPVEALDNPDMEKVSAVELASRVERRENGDVIITGIPMVNQGPKGYCVPATMERLLRYMGIPSDMYVIAMAVQIDTAGGTYTADVMRAVYDATRSRGFRVEKANSSLRINNISRYIDKGKPLLWAILVDPDLDRSVTTRGAQRKTTPDSNNWKTILKSLAKGRRVKPDKENGHICMIIGYNEKTDELAISDSLGPEFAERWITVDEADSISQRELWVID